MKKTKILFVVTQGGWGGAQRYVFDLATNMDRGKFEIEVATGAKTQGELVKKLTSHNIPIFLLKNLVRGYNPIANIGFTLELARLLEKSWPDVIHFNSTNAGIIGALAVFVYKLRTKNRKLKTVYTAHGFKFNEPGILKKFAFIVLEKFASRFRDKIICVSEADFNSAVKYGIAPREKLAVIHNGINDPKFLSKRDARKILPSLRENNILIGAISQFYPAKGLRYLVEAAKIVCRKNPDAIFAVIGGGPEEKKLKSAIGKSGLERNFFVLPYRESGFRYMPAFDLIATPSLKEGLPYFLIEAAFAGVPVVSTAVGGVPEIVEHGETGILVPPKNSQALAHAILELLGDGKKAGFYAKAGQTSIKEKFALEKMLNATEKIYENCSGKKPTSAAD